MFLVLTLWFLTINANIKLYLKPGRSLSNSIINLGIRDQCADALSQLGFEIEVLAEQVSAYLVVVLISAILAFMNGLTQ